jgi:NitT/TauT family transport system permease protein
VRRGWQVFWIALFLAIYSYVIYRAWGPETAMLPIYTLASLSRLVIAYIICLAFGLAVGIFAAMNKKAGDIIIPLLDILQSVPVLGFFPVAILILVPLFGFGIASIVLLFTSMAWSIVFGVIAGVKAIPQHIQDMAAIFNLRGWNYIKHVVLPSVYPSLIAGSILAFGGGWYFLIASEYVTYGTSTYTLPGLGYYLNIASFQHANIWMSLAGLLTIGLVVFCIHKLVWARLDRNAREAKFLHLHFGYDSGFDLPKHRTEEAQHKRVHFNRRHAHQWFFNIFKVPRKAYLALIAGIIAIGGIIIFASKERILLGPGEILALIGASFLRILLAYAIALVIAILIGFLLIRKPATRKAIMPLADVMQSIPALAYFPLIFLILVAFLPVGLTLEIACVILLLTGMLWYLLFNVIEAVQHLPADIDEVSRVYRIEGRSYVKDILVPAMFPALITGSILAFGGGWNAIIVAEYVNIGGEAHSITGIGAAMNRIAATPGGTPTLLVLLAAMTAVVLLLNHFIWRKLLNHASKYVLEED